MGKHKNKRVYSEEAKKILSEAAKRRKIDPINETLRRQKISEGNIRRYMNMSDDERNALTKKIVTGQQNKPDDEKLLWNIRKREARIREMKLKGESDIFHPSYNKNSIPIIEQYGKDNGYNFRHAENHPKGEFKIYDKENQRFYYADGYDGENNVWVEYDEFRKNKNTMINEFNRQQRIVDLLQCKFVRIKEKKGRYLSAI